jgi:plasmid stability protein
MVMIQVRDVPDDLHRALKARAASEGVSLSELIRRELPRIARRPSVAEMNARIERRGPLSGIPADFSATDVIRRHRDGADGR